VTAGKPQRLFLDSNVITGGILSPWGLDKSLLALCAARICRMILSEVVQHEVENNLIEKLAAGGKQEYVERTLADYSKLLALADPEIVPFPSLIEVQASRHLIRHEADVPVLLSAMASHPDWLITNNTKHFTPLVASKTGLRIVTSKQYFQSLARRIG
jgi:predicted nucleic acid-binding protein